MARSSKCSRLERGSIGEVLHLSMIDVHRARRNWVGRHSRGRILLSATRCACALPGRSEERQMPSPERVSTQHLLQRAGSAQSITTSNTTLTIHTPHSSSTCRLRHSYLRHSSSPTFTNIRQSAPDTKRAVPHCARTICFTSPQHRQRSHRRPAHILARLYDKVSTASPGSLLRLPIG